MRLPYLRRQHPATSSESPVTRERFPVETLLVEGVSVQMVRKNVKHVHLRVYPPDGRVKMSVPSALGRDAALRIIEKRIPWIKIQQQKLSVPLETVRYESGTELWLEGRPYRLLVSNGSGSSLRIRGDSVIEMTVRPGSSHELRERVFESWCRDRLRERAEELFDAWEKVLGVQASELRVRRMRTRWGTCNVAKRRIWLNLELVTKPPRCLEYVVVHELVHLIERGHGKRFAHLMDRSLPDWRETKKLLNTLPAR